MVNPGAFRLCARCGALMDTHLQESGGLRRTAPIQSPVPVATAHRLTPVQRGLMAAFLALLTLTYLMQLLPAQVLPPPANTAPPVGSTP